MQPDISPEGTVTIPIEEYMDLFRASCLLDELEGAGVDNWEGYEEIDRERVHEQCLAEKARVRALVKVAESPGATFTVRVSPQLASRIRSAVTLEVSVSDILRAGAEMWLQANSDGLETPA